jgi:hypothetical protein
MARLRADKAWYGRAAIATRRQKREMLTAKSTRLPSLEHDAENLRVTLGMERVVAAGGSWSKTRVLPAPF